MAQRQLRRCRNSFYSSVGNHSFFLRERSAIVALKHGKALRYATYTPLKTHSTLLSTSLEWNTPRIQSQIQMERASRTYRRLSLLGLASSHPRLAHLLLWPLNPRRRRRQHPQSQAGSPLERLCRFRAPNYASCVRVSWIAGT